MDRPIKFNLTVLSVFTKHLSELPYDIQQITSRYAKIEKARKVLLDSDLSPNQKIARMAPIAEALHKECVNLAENYKTSVVSKMLDFESNVSKLAAPRDLIHAIQQSSYLQYLMQNKDKVMTLVKEDRDVASAIFNLPKSIRSDLGVNEGSALMIKESLLPGYMDEISKYQALIGNTDLLKESVDSDYNPLYSSFHVRQAIEQESALESL